MDFSEKLVEESEIELRNKIIKLKGKAYLEGIDKKSKGHAGYYVLKKIVDSLEKEDAEKVSKQSDIGISDEEYKKAMEELENEKKIKRVHYDQSYDYDESNEEKDKIRKEIGESFKVLRGGKGYLLEANISQLKRTTLSEDPTRAKKSKNVSSKYLGISKYGVLNFETTSETHSGVVWYQEIQFPSFQGFMNIVESGDTIEVDDVQKAMKSDNIKISCDDPSFLYWAWKYKAWRDVYGLEKETRAPKRNNTRLQGALCKHLYSVIELLNERRIIELIARDLNKWCRLKLGMETDDGYQSPEMINKEFKANQYDYDIAEAIKGLLSPENYEAFKNGVELEDLDLSDEEIANIEDAIKHMRDRSQFKLKTSLEKALEPKKRGRKISRDDIKLQVDSDTEEGEL